MGQQDLYQSDFYDDKNRFADIFNGVLFDGKEVMKPEELESAKAIAGILKVKIDLDLIKMEDEEGKKVYDMCKAFDDYKEEGRREGERKGRREGRREGEIQALTTVVKNLMSNQKVTFEVAAEVLGISKGKQKKIKPLI